MNEKTASRFFFLVPVYEFFLAFRYHYGLNGPTGLQVGLVVLV